MPTRPSSSAAAHASINHIVACVPENLSLAMLFLALRSVVSSRPVPLASCRHPVLQDTTKTNHLPVLLKQSMYICQSCHQQKDKTGLQATLQLHAHREQPACYSFLLAVPQGAIARQVADMTHERPSIDEWGGSTLNPNVRVLSLLMLALTCTECSTAGLHAP